MDWVEALPDWLAWGDVPGWAAFVIASGALWMNIKTRQEIRRSADAAVESADAAVRSASAAEQALAEQQRAAEEQRAAAAEAARPKVDLRIERKSKNMYVLRNCGDATATNIVRLGDEPAVDAWPTQLTLGPQAGHEFFMVGSMANRVPSELSVVWDGQEEPVTLAGPR